MQLHITVAEKLRGNRGPGLGKGRYLLHTGFPYETLSLAASHVGYLFLIFFFFSEAWRKVKVWGRLSDRNLSTFFPVCARIYLISQLPMEEGWTEGLLEIRFACWPETVLRIQSPPLPSLAWFNHIKELLLVLSDERFRQKTSSG